MAVSQVNGVQQATSDLGLVKERLQVGAFGGRKLACDNELAGYYGLLQFADLMIPSMPTLSAKYECLTYDKLVAEVCRPCPLEHFRIACAHCRGGFETRCYETLQI